MLCILPVFAGCTFESRFPADMVTTTQSQPRDKEKALSSTIRFDIGSLEITAGKGMSALYSFELEYDKSGFEPDIQYDSNLSGEEGRLSFSLQGVNKPGFRREAFSNNMRLKFNDSIPIDLRVYAGVGDARLSLTGLKISHFAFESGVGEAKVSVFEPNAVSCEYIRLKNGVGGIEMIGLGHMNFRHLEFEGGVGGAEMDFSGDWKQDAEVRIQVGVGGVHLKMPRSVGVRVETERNFLSGVQLDGFTQKGSDYFSDSYDSSSIKVSIHVTTGIGGFKITWI